MAPKILIVDDEPFNLDLLEQQLAERGYAIERAVSGLEALQHVESSPPDVVLLDQVMPGMSGLDVLREIHRKDPEIVVIIVTAHGTIDLAVEAMKQGAYDFVTKPFDSDHVLLTVGRGLERNRLKRGLEILSDEVGERYRTIVGQSPQIAHAIDAAKKAATSKSTVLLLGESGTGKEIFARAIHAWSERKTEPFIAINCVGLSRELLESDLFGHERGAFTGAHQQKRGKIELADRGTVFFDEVGDISSELQTKFLRFLQERDFERVGGTKRITVDVKIVAATNRDLEAAVKEGRFREDLYYRLNVIPITLPPLRERQEDIVELARFFLRRFSAETKKRFTEFTPEAEEKLTTYAWPGNIRELANAIERAVVLGQGPTVALHELPPRVVAAESRWAVDEISYQKAVNAYRRELILRVLERHQGNRTAAAKGLGLRRTSLLRLLRALRIT
jgi:DNA-binding NtrC family response regulator